MAPHDSSTPMENIATTLSHRPMESCRMTSLPYDILLSVAGLLHASHRPSLFAFSLASRICHKAALHFVFRDVSLIVYDSGRLQHDVYTLTEILSRAESIHHVRHFTIEGYLKLTSDDQTNAVNIKGNRDPKTKDWFQLTGVGDILGNEEPYLGGDFLPSNVVKIFDEERLAWEPVVILLGKLPHLMRLVYDCSNQFPLSLLSTLHQYHPSCKLYHLHFRLQSILQSTLDPQELSLITSPNLHHIKITHAWRDTNGDDDFHAEAIPELVSGFAPNIKEINMVELKPSSSVRAKQRLRFAREPWRGLAGSVAGRSKANLTSLSLSGAALYGRDLFRTWSQYTDISLLSHLALGGGYLEYSGVNGEVLHWLAEHCSFPRLKTLRIRLSRDDHIDVKPDYTSDAALFFRTLEPLCGLSVDGPLEPEILKAILSRHGVCLETLSLRAIESPFSETRFHIPMVFERDYILQIEAQCPALKELCIPVKRTKSDPRETEIYKSFKEMKSLQRLFLILECSDWGVTRNRTPPERTDPFLDENDNKPYLSIRQIPKIGHLRETFINCAVDETLVRSIWDTICRGKVGKHIDSLKVYTTGGGEYGINTNYNEISRVVENLSRSWVVRRALRDDKDTISVEELGSDAREARDRLLSAFYDKHYKGDRTGALLPAHSAVHIFRRIWPRTAQSEDWRKDWASFPLATVVRE